MPAAVSRQKSSPPAPAITLTNCRTKRFRNRRTILLRCPRNLPARALFALKWFPARSPWLCLEPGPGVREGVSVILLALTLIGRNQLEPAAKGRATSARVECNRVAVCTTGETRAECSQGTAPLQLRMDYSCIQTFIGFFTPFACIFQYFDYSLPVAVLLSPSSASWWRETPKTIDQRAGNTFRGRCLCNGQSSCDRR
jgi:hypothetical protein